MLVVNLLPVAIAIDFNYQANEILDSEHNYAKQAIKQKILVFILRQ